MTNTLLRRLGLADAVFIGLGSMIGAGVFASFAPAAAAAGSGLLIGLALAALVAYCNATASAQLAASYPTSGGTYADGRAELGEWSGFTAGWSFIIGKIASCSAMALTFAAYAAPAGWERPVAVAAVIALVTVNYFGVTRTAQVTRVIVVIVLAALAVVIAAGFAGGGRAGWLTSEQIFIGGWRGILQAGGLLFFAFAGYARIATMGEEVVEPRRTIPRAILAALAIVVALYAVIAVSLLTSIGPEAIARTPAPLAAAVSMSGWTWAGPVVRIGAAFASLGALLGLIAGIGRTTLAMAREADLPTWLSGVHPRWRVPPRAEILVGVIVVTIVSLVDLRSSIGFSSFGVLTYYFIANLSALQQKGNARLYPKALQWLGMALCAVLAVNLPIKSVIVGAIVIVIGLVYRAVRLGVTREKG